MTDYPLYPETGSHHDATPPVPSVPAFDASGEPIQRPLPAGTARSAQTVEEARENVLSAGALDSDVDALIAAARAEERAKAELNYEKGYAAGKLYAHAYVMIRTRAATLAEVREKVRAMDGVVAEVGDDNLLCVTQAHGFPTWLVRRTDVLAVLAALEEGK